MREKDISKKALPMNFMVMEELRDALHFNMKMFKAIKFIITYGLEEPENLDQVKKLAPSFSNLISFWMQNHIAIIDRAVDEFERMNLILILSAESVIELIETKSNIPEIAREHVAKRLRKSIEGMNFILQEKSYSQQHEHAAMLQARCKSLMTQLNLQ